MQKVRADVLLVERGLAASREKARALIMAGQVYSGGRRITKPGESVKSDEELSVKGAACPFVGRGGLKLQKAVDVFDERYASERPQKQEQPADTPPDTQKEEKQKDSGEGFLQNIARLMDGYGVSSIDELIRSIDEPPKPKK